MTFVLLVAACQPGPTAPPPTLPAVEVTEGPAATEPAPSPAATAASSPTPLLQGQPVAPTTSLGKILAAVEDGSIDRVTGYRYRAQASVGDPDLPHEYWGDAAEDLELDLALRTELATLPAEARQQLLPYLVRPTDPVSYWNQPDPVPSPEGAGRVAVVPRIAPAGPPAALACVDGWMHDRVSGSIPVMLWSRCAFDPGAASARIEETRGHLQQLWLPETNLMGLPLGDRNVPNDAYPDVPEGDDGLIDVYLVSWAPSQRDLTVPASVYGRTTPTSPFEGPAGAERSSSFLVIRPSLTGVVLKATLAHELFHVLQNSHNALGRIDCPPKLLGTSCPGSGQSHWFTEASAQWSEHEFVPEARTMSDGPYDQWDRFRATTEGLSVINGQNEYQSWLWPYFLEQEGTADSIGNIWRSLRGKVGWWAFQRTVDAELSFEQRFDDFAVEILNLALLPGDPISPRFRSGRLDPAFPETTPLAPRYDDTIQDDLAQPLQAPSTRYAYSLAMESLSSAYFPFAPPPGAHTLRIELAALAPEIEADAIVRVGTTWQRRELPAGETTWCLDSPKDAVEEVYLVFSDNSQQPGRITRPWSITAEEAGCGSSLGTLTYSFLDSAPLASQPGGSVTVDASVQVHLKANDGTEGFAAEFLNDGSTYGLNTTSKSLLPVGLDGCQPSAIVTGTPGGGLDVDSIVADAWVDEDGKQRLTVAVSLPVHQEIHEDWCAIGSNTYSAESTIQFPSCDGTQTTETDASRVYAFDCDFQAGSTSSSVSGTVVVTR